MIVPLGKTLIMGDIKYRNWLSVSDAIVRKEFPIFTIIGRNSFLMESGEERFTSDFIGTLEGSEEIRLLEGREILKHRIHDFIRECDIPLKSYAGIKVQRIQKTNSRYGFYDWKVWY